MTANINIKTDAKLKSQAEKLFSDLGMNMTTALNIFLRQSVRENRIPFEITREIPNDKTLAAAKEVEDMKKNPERYKSYSSAQEMMQDILS